jgi:hypothetical protein
MIKKIISLDSTDFRGLLHVFGEFRFVNQADIIKLFIRIFYPKTAVVVIYGCQKAFEDVPKLNIKKRDNFSTYMAGKMSDLAFVEFDSPLVASDWAFAFPVKSGIHWEVYSNGTLIRNEKGKVKPPKPAEKGVPDEE